jgi:hypothetical protein
MRRINPELVYTSSMNFGLTAVLIGVLFVALKFALHYKESPTPDMKEGVLAVISALGGLYAMDLYSQRVTKSVEVFTNKPEF